MGSPPLVHRCTSGRGSLWVPGDLGCAQQRLIKVHIALPKFILALCEMARQEKLWLVFFGEGIAERHQ